MPGFMTASLGHTDEGPVQSRSPFRLPLPSPKESYMDWAKS
ncbi:predicted protein [Plenodomus lingam JN3]|uniref:Predicted protein n=1 Tax=Leptosphaeria maculans (strain JN3 / isolate v23.1.3 / race Av1-4-5-6-7-8) TaxID=985895 RepID=E4ZVP7_LEPMJ|nr:predicted protein [Plenodomus lingam JN3]CBX95673.1 predicted protein [Plenodomus lingam JN3]